MFYKGNYCGSMPGMNRKLGVHKSLRRFWLKMNSKEVNRDVLHALSYSRLSNDTDIPIAVRQLIIEPAIDRLSKALKRSQTYIVKRLQGVDGAAAAWVLQLKQPRKRYVGRGRFQPDKDYWALISSDLYKPAVVTAM